MIRALVFDFDGLIVDTETPEFRAWEAIFAEHGQKLPMESWACYVGRRSASFDPYAALAEALGRPVARAEIRARKRALFEIHFADRGLLPGVADYFTTAQRLGLKMGLASSASRKWIEGHLERLGIGGHFEVVLTGDDAVETKPHPELFLRALEGLGVPAAEGLALGDSPNGALAAQRVRLFCVVVPNGITRQMAFPAADWVLDSLADMPLERLLAEVERRNG